MKIKHIEKAESIIIFTLLALLPIFFLPIFPNAFITPKLILLGALVAALILMKSAKVILKGTISYTASALDLPVILLAGAFLASTFLRTPNKYEALFLPGNAIVISLGALLYLCINQLKTNTKKALVFPLALSGALSSVAILISNSGVLKGTNLPEFMKTSGFTTFEGILPAIIYLTAVLPLAIDLILKETDVFRKAFWGISTTLITFALIMSVFNILPGKPNEIRLPSLKTSWAITVDSLKESPFLGVGPGNYLTAFNKYRPLEYNQTKLWQMRFISSRNFYFTAITESGLIAAAALALLFYTLSKIFSQNNKEKHLVGWTATSKSTNLSLIILLVLLAFFPGTITVLVLLFTLLSINSITREIKLTTLSQNSSDDAVEQIGNKLPSIITTLPALIITGLFLFQGAKAVRAEYRFKKSLDAVAQNNGGIAYDLLQRAINTNPRIDRYHISYAQLNLALANSIARKEEVTDEDRTTITQLIQQSIQAGKNAVGLNPSRAGNWEMLAQIYNQISPLAQNAQGFAIQSYSQAINLDPINPNTRIALGGIYYANKAFDEAVRVFELATVTKPDLANAHYNLAFALKEAGKLDRAIYELTVTLSLVDRNSPDYETVKKALEDLESQKESEAPESENLTPPQEQEQVLTPPIELPEDAQPPQPETSPTPTPSPEASPTPLP